MSYHVDRFYAAVSVLAAHGHIKQRLITAFEDHLAALTEDDLPIPVRQSFADLRLQMHHVLPLNGEGPVCASVRKMSIEQASECAVSILDLYREVMRLGADGQPVMPLSAQDQPTVPPFLVKSN